MRSRSVSISHQCRPRGRRARLHVDPNASFPTEQKGTAWLHCKQRIATSPPKPVDGLTDPCPAPGYRLHTAVGAGAISSPYLCHGCGAWFTLPETRVLPPGGGRA